MKRQIALAATLLTTLTMAVSGCADSGSLSNSRDLHKRFAEKVSCTDTSFDTYKDDELGGGSTFNCELVPSEADVYGIVLHDRSIDEAEDVKNDIAEEMTNGPMLVGKNWLIYIEQGEDGLSVSQAADLLKQANKATGGILVGNSDYGSGVDF